MFGAQVRGEWPARARSWGAPGAERAASPDEYTQKQPARRQNDTRWARALWVGAAPDPWGNESRPGRSARPDNLHLRTTRRAPRWWSAWPDRVRETVARYGSRSTGDADRGRVEIAIHLHLNETHNEHDDSESLGNLSSGSNPLSGMTRVDGAPGTKSGAAGLALMYCPRLPCPSSKPCDTQHTTKGDRP